MQSQIGNKAAQRIQTRTCGKGTRSNATTAKWLAFLALGTLAAATATGCGDGRYYVNGSQAMYIPASQPIEMGQNTEFVTSNGCAPGRTFFPVMGCVENDLLKHGMDTQARGGIIVNGNSVTYGVSGASPDDEEEDSETESDANMHPLKAFSKTVHDPNTGLIWQRRPAQETFDVANAKRHCAALPLGGNGWRAPSRQEMLSIMRKGFESGVDPKIFPGSDTKDFLTVTKNKSGPIAVHGMTGMVTQAYGPAYVLCVRDNSSAAVSSR